MHIFGGPLFSLSQSPITNSLESLKYTDLNGSHSRPLGMESRNTHFKQRSPSLRITAVRKGISLKILKDE